MEIAKVKHYSRKALIVLHDVIMTALAAMLALWLTEENTDTIQYHDILLYLIPLVGITIVVFAGLKLYNSLWRYAGISEIVKIFLGIITVLVVNIILVCFILEVEHLSWSWCLIFALLQMAFTMASRFFFRIIRHYFSHKNVPFKKSYREGKIKVMVIGGGEAGVSLIREMQSVEDGTNINY